MKSNSRSNVGSDVGQVVRKLGMLLAIVKFPALLPVPSHSSGSILAQHRDRVYHDNSLLIGSEPPRVAQSDPLTIINPARKAGWVFDRSGGFAWVAYLSNSRLGYAIGESGA